MILKFCIIYWSLFAVVWTGRECGQPPQSHGTDFHIGVNEDPALYKGSTFPHGQKIRYRCGQGFSTTSYSGSMTECNDGNWTPMTLQCTELTCGALNPPSNGRRLDDDYTIGSFAMFACNPGFDLQGPSRLLCRVDGEWNPREPPRCIPVKCPDVSYIANGRSFQENWQRPENTYQNAITYSCDEGYRIDANGDARRVCQADGTWSGIMPECTTPRCPKIPFGNGKVTYFGEREVYTLAFFECNENFDLSSVSNTECEQNLQWVEIPQCIPRLKPLVPTNGNTSRVDLVKNGESYTLHCNDDCFVYFDELRQKYLGESVRVKNILGNLTYDGVHPVKNLTCKDACCAAPLLTNGKLFKAGVLRDSAFSKNTLNTGEKVLVKCNDDYKLYDRKKGTLITSKFVILCNLTKLIPGTLPECITHPGPFLITSNKESRSPGEYNLSWTRPQTSTTISSYTIKWRKVTVQNEGLTPDGKYILYKAVSAFGVEKIPVQENYRITSLDPATFYQVEIKATNAVGSSVPVTFIFKTGGCVPGQFQCHDGDCISYNTFCDKKPDCLDNSDEQDCGPIQILNSHIAVTSDGVPWADMFANRTNDGLVNNQGIADNCGCCAALRRPAWVQLTLDKIYLVEQIIVLGRNDGNPAEQFNKIRLSMGRQDQSLQNVTFTSKNQTVAMTILAPPLEVDVVRVSGDPHGYDDHMTICEIMIYRQAGGCVPGQFQCHNGDCISNDTFCDKKPDCFDNSDEQDCDCQRPKIENATIEPNKTTYRHFEQITVRCIEGFAAEHTVSDQPNNFTCNNGVFDINQFTCAKEQDTSEADVQESTVSTVATRTYSPADDENSNGESQKRDCPRPTMEHAILEPNKTTYRHLEQITVKCIDGFTAEQTVSDNSKQIMCDDGAFDINQFKCAEKQDTSKADVQESTVSTLTAITSSPTDEDNITAKSQDTGSCILPASEHITYWQNTEMFAGQKVENETSVRVKLNCQTSVGDYSNYGNDEVTDDSNEQETEIQCLDGNLRQHDLACKTELVEETTPTPKTCKINNGRIQDRGRSVECDANYTLVFQNGMDASLYTRFSCKCDPITGRIQCLGFHVECEPMVCKIPTNLKAGLTIYDPIERAFISSANKYEIKHGAFLTFNCPSSGNTFYEPKLRQFVCEKGSWVSTQRPERKTTWEMDNNGSFPECRQVKCPAGHCKNGGYCFRDYECHCPENTKGARCEPICRNGCQNGGTCIAPDKCECRVGFKGRYCEISGCTIPEGNLVNMEKQLYNNGDTIRITERNCESGYLPSSVDMTLVCERGQWSGKVLCVPATLYSIHVVTADKRYAGTDGYVRIRLNGITGNTGHISLQGYFEQNYADDFDKYLPDIGTILTLDLGVTRRYRVLDGWIPSHVTVHDQRRNQFYLFKHNETELDNRSITLARKECVTEYTVKRGVFTGDKRRYNKYKYAIYTVFGCMMFCSEYDCVQAEYRAKTTFCGINTRSTIPITERMDDEAHVLTPRCVKP